MNLYFQFLTQNQSITAIDLVHLPALPALEQTVAGETKISTAGKLLSSKFLNIETLLPELTQTRFNELEIIYDIRELKFGSVIARVKSLNGVFYPSPTCKLWFPSKDFPRSEDRRGGQRKMNAKAKELSLVDYHINVKPSVFEVALEIETSESEAKVLDGCAEWFSIAAQNFEKHEVFGCCDAGGNEMFVRLESHVLMLDKIRVMKRMSPAAYPRLGKKFDDLHPVMFGAKQVCSELAAALGENAKLVCGADASDFAVIRLNPMRDIAAARELAKDWLLPTIR